MLNYISPNSNYLNKKKDVFIKMWNFVIYLGRHTHLEKRRDIKSIKKYII